MDSDCDREPLERKAGPTKNENRTRRLIRSLPDLLVTLGGGLVALGCWLAWPPLGLVAGGAGLVGVALAIERRRAVVRARARYRKATGRDPDPES